MQKVENILKIKGFSFYDLEKAFDYPRGALFEMVKGKRPFTDEIKQKLLPILEVSEEEFESWIIADKYPKEIIEKAINALKSRNDKEVSVLSQNVNTLLKEKGVSQTSFGKIIKHSQSALSCAIAGKEPMSKKLMQKISTGLEITVDDIQAWILADKYSTKVLELALENYTT